MITATVQRRLWLAVGSLVAALLLLTTLTWGAAAFARERGSFQEVVDEPVASLFVDAGAGGSVRVVGTDDDEVVIDGETQRGLVSPAHEQVVSGDRLEVRSDCGPPGPIAFALFCSTDYTIQVPEEVDVEVRSHGAGVTVEGVDGFVEVHTEGGGITAVDLGGDAELRTQGGGVDATNLRSPNLVADVQGGGVDLAYLEAPSSVSVGTSGGGATVLLPEGPAGYVVDTRASGGSEVIDVRTDPDADRLLRIRTSGGGITLRYQDLP